AEAIGACGQVCSASWCPVSHDTRACLTVRSGGGVFRITAVFGPCAETHRGIGRSDIAQGDLSVSNVEVEALARRVAVRQLQSAYPRVKPPARRYEIRRAEQGLSCPEGIRPDLNIGERNNIGERCQGQGFRIPQLAARVVAQLPQPRRSPFVAGEIESGKLVVAGIVPCKGPLKTLPAHRHVEVEPEGRSALSITPRRRADILARRILRDA